MITQKVLEIEDPFKRLVDGLNQEGNRARITAIKTPRRISERWSLKLTKLYLQH